MLPDEFRRWRFTPDGNARCISQNAPLYSINFRIRFRASQFLAKMAVLRLHGTTTLAIEIGYLELRAIFIANPVRRPPHARPCCSADRIKIAWPPLGCAPQNFRRENIFRRKTKLSNAILNFEQDGFRGNPSFLDKPRLDLRLILQVLSIRFHAARPQLPGFPIIETERHRHASTRQPANSAGQY